MGKIQHYKDWSQQDLIDRVEDLEFQIRKLQSKALKDGTKPQQAPRIPRELDPSRYHTRKIALKFAYFGGKYNGLEYHKYNVTRRQTVEEVIWRALMKTKLIFPNQEGENAEHVNWEGCEYSKCGRTDVGVSAFGQVISLRVRSARPKKRPVVDVQPIENGLEEQGEGQGYPDNVSEDEEAPFDSIKDEIPYVRLLNRVLPPDVRVLAWCGDLPPDFNARFSCRERRYRYFFTNPALRIDEKRFGPHEGRLDIQAMEQAAKKYEGVHDWRHFCKIDASKQIYNYVRRIYSAGIHAVDPQGQMTNPDEPQWYYFEVRGSAFLWHQVRHLVAILFLIGQGLEKPSLVDELLDVVKTPKRPVYEMAADDPLVLWDCIYPDLTATNASDHVGVVSSHEESLPWVYEDALSSNPQDAIKSNKLAGDLWEFWRSRKIDEVLSKQLMTVVSEQQSGQGVEPTRVTRIFDGSSQAKHVGVYIPVMQRQRIESFEVTNARWKARKLAAKTEQTPDEIAM